MIKQLFEDITRSYFFHTGMPLAFGSGHREFVLRGSWGEQSLGCSGDQKALWGEASIRSGPASCPGGLVGLIQMHLNVPHEPRMSNLQGAAASLVVLTLPAIRDEQSAQIWGGQGYRGWGDVLNQAILPQAEP